MEIKVDIDDDQGTNRLIFSNEELDNDNFVDVFKEFIELNEDNDVSGTHTQNIGIISLSDLKVVVDGFLSHKNYNRQYLDG